MITINELKINDIVDTISVNVTTEIGYAFTKVLVWDSTTFKNTATAIDLSTLLTGASENEVFTIGVVDLNVSKITGIYFVEFTTNEPGFPTILGAVANLIPYHECVMNKLLSSSIDSCTTTAPDILYLNVCVETLVFTIQTGFFEEAIKIMKEMDKLCGICGTCPDYSDTLLVNGLGFGTIDNAIILI